MDPTPIALPLEEHPDEHGIPIESCTDLSLLREIAVALWVLLDNIDTAGDIAKENHELYRSMTEKYQSQRWKFITSDGYRLYIPHQKAQGETKHE
jgi:hypothetical protein